MHVYEGASQGKQLAVELNCIGWAGVLLDMVYQFTKNWPHRPPFDIPQLRFVGAGLAVSHSSTRETFLIEELITERPFVKYINNSSAQPISFSDNGRARIAKFLSFCQHVQWEKTKGQVYVSDFQGIYSTSQQTLIADEFFFRKWDFAHRSANHYPPVRASAFLL